MRISCWTIARSFAILRSFSSIVPRRGHRELEVKKRRVLCRIIERFIDRATRVHYTMREKVKDRGVLGLTAIKLNRSKGVPRVSTRGTHGDLLRGVFLTLHIIQPVMRFASNVFATFLMRRMAWASEQIFMDRSRKSRNDRSPRCPAEVPRRQRCAPRRANIAVKNFG